MRAVGLLELQKEVYSLEGWMDERFSKTFRLATWFVNDVRGSVHSRLEQSDVLNRSAFKDI